MNLVSGNITLGQASLMNVYLQPGNNTLPLRGVLDLKTLIENLPTLIESEASALESGNLRLQATGNSSVFNGESITYFDDVLSRLVLTGDVSIIKLLNGTSIDLENSTNPILRDIGNAISAINSTGIPSDLLKLLAQVNLTSILDDLGNLFK